MLKKSISIAVIIALINLAGAVSAFAGSNSEKERSRAIRVRESIRKLGMGERAKVKVRLKNKAQIEGYVSDIGEDSFTVVASETGQPAVIEYRQVKKVKGGNLSTGAKIAIGFGIAAAVLAVAVLANRKVCKTGLCQ